MSHQEEITLEYFSRLILSGVRPHELVLLNKLVLNERVLRDSYRQDMKEFYGYKLTDEDIDCVVSNLEGHFVSKKSEYDEKYIQMEILKANDSKQLQRLTTFANRLRKKEFSHQLKDIINVGISRYEELYKKEKHVNTPFVLYEKYSRRDVSYLSDCGKDLSSIMYGKWDYKDDVYLFVTYHKQANTEEDIYIEGKPDYADEFEDNVTFRWDSKIGNGIGGAYVNSICNAARKHLLIKKTDNEIDFYYMGQFDVLDLQPGSKKNDKGQTKEITKFTLRMHTPVREDILRYLRSNITVEEKIL